MLNNKKILCILIVLCIFLSTPVFAYNEKELEICNIVEWHNNGFTGKGVSILIMDIGYINPDSNFINMDNIIDLNGNVVKKTEMTSEDTHIQMVVQVIQQVAPDSTMYVYNGGLGRGIEMAVENDIQIISRSKNVDTIFLEKLNETSKKIYEKNIFMNGSSGNESSERINGYANNPYWFSTGAVRLRHNGEDIRRESYSSYGDGLDFMGFARLELYADINNTGEGIPTKFSGTSASTPLVSGMVALYQQYYKDINGVFPSIKEVEQFIIDNSMDLEYEGYDIYTGHGLFVLPNLEESENSVDITQVNNTMTRNIGFECITR